MVGLYNLLVACDTVILCGMFIHVHKNIYVYIYMFYFFFCVSSCGCWSPQLFLFYLKGKQMRVQQDGVMPCLSGNLYPLLFIDGASVVCGIILDVQYIYVHICTYIYIYACI